MSPVADLQAGVWRVGDAGSVTFGARGGMLVLEEVSPARGWCPIVKRQDPDCLEVEFHRGGKEWEFQARYRNGKLSVELEHEEEQAGPGRYQVGEAGAVEIAVEGGELRLVEIDTNPGWAMEIEEHKQREIEIEFRRGDLEWEFEAELSKDGELEVDIEMEIEAPFPTLGET